jgi:hypothetical protein
MRRTATRAFRSSSGSICGRSAAGRGVAGHERAEDGPAALAGQLEGKIGVDDRARVHGLERALEEIDALQEERALLLEEERETLVRGHHGRVRLHLREVRVERHVQRGVRREAQLRRQPGIHVEGAVHEALRTRAALPASGARRHQARDDLQRTLGGEVVEARDVPGLGQETRLPAHQRPPGVLLVVQPLDASQHVHAPAAPVPGFVAQGAEGHRDLDRVALAGQQTLRLHDHVHAVVRLAALRPDAVLLDAQRVEGQQVGAAPVVERVQEDTHVVVVQHRVARRDAGAYAAPLVRRPHADVQGAPVVPETHLGRVRRRRVVARLRLHERRQAGALAPRRFREEPVDRRSRSEAGHADGRVCRRAQGLRQQQPSQHVTS